MPTGPKSQVPSHKSVQKQLGADVGVARDAAPQGLSVAAEVTTIITGIITVGALLFAFVNKRLKKITENSSSKQVERLLNRITELEKQFKSSLDKKVDHQKRTSREHLQNEIAELEEDLGTKIHNSSRDLTKDLNHAVQLIEQRFTVLENDLKTIKEDILMDREQTMTAQLQISDALARVDMINQRLNAMGQ